MRSSSLTSRALGGDLGVEPRPAGALDLEADPLVERATEFVDLLADQLTAHAGAEDRRVAAVAAVGALSSLYASYLDGTLPVSRATLVAACVKVVETAYTP